MPTSTRKIVHIDMDCFYAAIEMRDNPRLAGIPIAVGGSPDKRGVISTCNYLARKYGVHSAMSSKRALQLCPSLEIIPGHFNKYREASQQIRAIFHYYTDVVEPLSLDEAFLDVTNCDFHQGSATLIAESIRQDIKKTTQLTASAGVSSNKLLAKIASDWKKPDGLFVIRPDEIDFFMKTLPVKKLFGVGKVTANKLHNLGIDTCHDCQTYSQETLIQYFGTYGERLYHLCRGIDERKVELNRERKSVSVETTFEHDIATINACESDILKLFDELEKRLQKHDKKSIYKHFVKIKFSDFQRTTKECVNQTLSLNTFKHLFIEAFNRSNKAIRLIGLGVRFKEEEKISQTQQLSLDF